MLGELGLLRSEAGMVVLGAAVIDDVIGLVVLALVVAASGSSGASPLLTIVPMALTLAISALAIRVLGPWIAAGIGHLHLRGGGSAATVALVLAAAWAFQTLGGLAGITGAYLAGFALAGSPVAPNVRDRLTHAGESFCVPVFFVAIGLAADLRSVGPVLPVALALLGVAVLGKLIGSGIGARLGGLDGRSSMLVGTGMIARGEVALVAATIGLQSGAIGAGLYTAVVTDAIAGLSAAHREADARLATNAPARDRVRTSIGIYLDHIASHPQTWAWPLRGGVEPVEAQQVRRRARAGYVQALSELLGYGDWARHHYALWGYFGFLDEACLAWVDKGCPSDDREQLIEASLGALEGALGDWGS